MKKINDWGHPWSSYTNRCFLCRVVDWCRTSKRKNMLYSCQTQSSVNVQMLCSWVFEGLAVHRYKNKVNNTRLINKKRKKNSPPSATPLLQFSENACGPFFFFLNKTITTLAATDAAVTKTHSHWHSQFVFCPALVSFCLLSTQKKKTQAKASPSTSLNEPGWQERLVKDS